MNKLIPVLIFINSYSLFAKEPVDALTINYAPRQSAFAAPRYGGGEGGNVHFYYDITLGYAQMKGSGPAKFKYGGFVYSGELGAKFKIRARRDYAENLLGVGLGGIRSNVSKLVFGLVVVPITYTHMGFVNGAGSGGFYAQIGILPTYVYSVQNNDGVKITSHFTNFYAEPTVSMGIHMRFTLWRNGSEVGRGRVFVGPYFSYGIGNLSKDNGETVTPGYKIGFRWSYLY